MIAWLHSFRKWCWLTFAIGLLAAVGGQFGGGNRLLFAAGLAAMIGVALLIAARRKRVGVRIRGCAEQRGAAVQRDKPAQEDEIHDDAEESLDQAGDISIDSPSGEGGVHEFVDALLRGGRYALLLRPQVAAGLDASLVALARQRLEQQMSIVPEGDVLVEPHLLAEEPITEAETIAARGNVVRVDSTYLDRYNVTNRQYQVFVNAGGYDQMALWDPMIWPAVVDFVDATGHPGPRYWQHGRFPRGKADHPVVGVSWFEAAAYARWVGKRLPRDAEWLKAGVWPVQLSPASRVQRKFPWGNTIDRSRANLWGAGPGDTTPVDDFGSGASVGGISQLIGNVWEWTDADFELPLRPANRRDALARSGVRPAATVGNVSASAAPPSENNADHTARQPLKTIRGGAFDTYFDHHAACQFASADSPLARKYNIGFRLALSACDIAAASEAGTDAGAASGETKIATEVEALQPV